MWLNENSGGNFEGDDEVRKEKEVRALNALLGFLSCPVLWIIISML